MFDLPLLAVFKPNDSHNHMYSMNTKQAFMGCNDQQAQHVGLSSAQELVGKLVDDVYPKIVSDPIITNNEKILSTGIAKLFEEYVMLASGEMLVYSSYKYPLKNERNKVSGVMGMSIPIEHIPPNSLHTINTLTEEPQCLTPGQLKCFIFLLKGWSSNKIALKMQVPDYLIENYIAHILLKLDCKNINELILRYSNRYDAVELSQLYSINEEIYIKNELHIPHALDNQLVKLTKQQSCCFELALKGYNAKEIAQQMNLSYRTIQHYTACIYEKLGLNNRYELIRHYAHLSE